jgi:hypothetical protein
MGNWKYLPPHGKPNPALSLNAKTFYRKKVAPPGNGIKYILKPQRTTSQAVSITQRNLGLIQKAARLPWDTTFHEPTSGSTTSMSA